MNPDPISLIAGIGIGALLTHQIWDLIHRELMYQQTAKVIRLMAQPHKEDQDA